MNLLKENGITLLASGVYGFWIEMRKKIIAILGSFFYSSIIPLIMLINVEWHEEEPNIFQRIAEKKSITGSCQR
jgi:hypothetical protein